MAKTKEIIWPIHDLAIGDQAIKALQADTAGFEKLAAFLKKEAGISLLPIQKNLCLMAGRLFPTLRELQFSTYQEYYAYLLKNPGAVPRFISALTTNTTEFMREAVHFEVLQQALAKIRNAKLAANTNEIRIWCVACSTGQEVYSIMMTILQVFPDTLGWDFKILATDIDREVLEKAAEGKYTEAEVARLPKHYLSNYFHEKTIQGKKYYSVRSEVKKRIRFANFNITSEPYPFQHAFDVVFCRNVLIYFDRETAMSVVDRLTKSVANDGYLFLGHSETGIVRQNHLKPISHAVYVKVK